MFRSLRSFPFFSKERIVLSILLRSYSKEWKRTKRYILRVLFRSKKRTLRSFPFFSRVFGDLWDPKERYVFSRSFGKNVTFFPSFSVHLKRMGWRGSYILRYKKCCFEIWEALCWGECRGHTFRDMGGVVLRYCRGCFEIWEVLKSVFGRRGYKFCRNDGLVVSVRPCRRSSPSSGLDPCSFFRFTVCTWITKYSDICAASEGRKEGIKGAVGESQTVPRYFNCSQSRTVPMYITFWQLHSHLFVLSLTCHARWWPLPTYKLCPFPSNFFSPPAA